MASHDFGTVRINEAAGLLEVSFPFGDSSTKDVVKGFRGRWNADKRLWTVDLAVARTDAATVVQAVRDGLVKAAPEAWIKALPALSKAAVTTKRYTIAIGEGGVRLGVPPGTKHEYTLKAKKDEGVAREGFIGAWLIPAFLCVDASIRGIIADVLRDDRASLARMLDHMEGFTLNGSLDMVLDERARIGLAPGAIVFADPSFVRKADPDLPRENLHEYPFRTEAVDEADDGLKVKLSFVTREHGWNALRVRYGLPEGERTARLDKTHVAGRWVRRRG